jgi:hypothetical protein
VLGRDGGCARYQWIEGERLRKDDLDEAVIGRLAEYCAFRAREFVAEAGVQEGVDLESMARVNLLEEFGCDEIGCDLSLLNRGPKIVTDCRMQPHYWLRTPAGKIIKTSGNLHGDDHLFPGPCDIAWDLAAAIMEWEMGECVANHFLSLYESRAGDNARARVSAFLIGYAAFRMGYCKMGVEAMAGTDEAARLCRDFAGYRKLVAAHIASPRVANAA